MKVELVGPFWPQYRVKVGEHQVPHLTVEPPRGEDGHPAPLNDERLFLSCDDRFGLYTTREEVDRWLPFLADCMAVAAGYPCHGAPEKMPAFRKMGELGGLAGDKPKLTIVPKRDD